MQRAAKVRLYWLSPENGGRACPFNGAKYTPTARFAGESDQFSVVLRFVHADQPNPPEATLALLFDNLEDIQARICPGVELEIMEGARQVAHCEIVSLTEEMPEVASRR